SDKPKRKPLPVEEELTYAEKAVKRAAWGEVLMQERNTIGPRRIEISEAQKIKRTPPKETSTETEQPMPKEAGMSKATAGSKNVRKAGIGGHDTKLPSYFEDKMTQGAAGKKKEEPVNNPRLTREFGSMPEQKELQPLGHAKIDCGVKLCMKEKNAISFVSSYGTLRIESVGKDALRVMFQKGQGKSFPKVNAEFAGIPGNAQVREARDYAEISNGRVTARVMKKTGEVTFLDRQGKVLLAERIREPRQVEKELSYTFLAFTKKEELYAKPPAGKLPHKIGSSAVVISFGEDPEMPGIRSSNGYELYFPAGRKTTCCNIPMYGPYVSQAGEGTEYYIKLS
ncbi:MAG: DUF4968 domain-containing protein, partial [Lachnospiraceae bacterium]|nr:DUF4968 domain-containing protein [Lachnospiraceae bacterium]